MVRTAFQKNKQDESSLKILIARSNEQSFKIMHEIYKWVIYTAIIRHIYLKQFHSCWTTFTTAKYNTDWIEKFPSATIIELTYQR